MKARLADFIAKLGKAWDNDPRVAAVELGLWGRWGEHNLPDTVAGGTGRIPADMQTVLGDAAKAAFRNKKVMIRYPETFVSYDFGEYWDSFALPDDAPGGNGEIVRNNWQAQMMSGEVAYDWGDQSRLGGSPNGTLSSDSHTDYVIRWIQRTHTSSLGWISDYTSDGRTISANAAKMQRALGYRYVVDQATFPTRADAGARMNVSFLVSNVGSAPFYYRWPVEAYLLNPDRSAAWKGTFGVDIRNWMPGESDTISGSFALPTDLATGTYTLAFAVNNPAGDLPGLRFANINYYTGGYTPVGKVGVGEAAGDQNLGTFNGIRADTTLHYIIGGFDPQAAENLACSNGGSHSE